MIQAVVLAELDGLNTPNPAGHHPLLNNDPTRPNEAYFEDVDWIVDRAEEHGVYMGMLPTWGDIFVGDDEERNTASLQIMPVVVWPGSAMMLTSPITFAERRCASLR